MTRIIAIAALALTVAACSTTRQCPTGQTAVSLVNDVLTYTPVMGACPTYSSPGPNTGGVFADGHMPAPAPGMGWR